MDCIESGKKVCTKHLSLHLHQSKVDECDGLIRHNCSSWNLQLTCPPGEGTLLPVDTSKFVLIS